ncbi:MAG: primosomal protein N' [Steroidobacteraceae bacterium]
MDPSSPQIVAVAVDLPTRQCFDYRLGSTVTDGTTLPGRRVRVPFGRSQRIGVIVAVVEKSDLSPEKLKSVTALIDDEPLFDAPLLATLRWAAGYYHYPLGQVLFTALPRKLRDGAARSRHITMLLLGEPGETALASGELSRAKTQRSLLEMLKARGPLPLQTVFEALPAARRVCGALLQRGWLQTFEAEPPRLSGEAMIRSGASKPQLRPEQGEAAQAICDSLPGFCVQLLQGITGSGKTEVYLEATSHALQTGRSVLVLVPEIGLTPQLVERFRGRFDERGIAVLHSALTDNERLDAWRDADSGRARIVLGTRSAVFAPMRELGLIIVDEEHDASFKQQEGGFRYSARDVAAVRARQRGVPLVLGSATPALETLHNVRTGRYRALHLRQRAGAAGMPQLRLIDLTQEPVHQGLSHTVLHSLTRHVESGQQALVFINRRGFAPTLACTACGWIAPCRNCDARMTVHRGANDLRCHHCGAEAPLPERCPVCGFATRAVGQGTERVEQVLAERFGAALLARLDRDTASGRGNAARVVERIRSGSARILVGTQMVTKGHDFPQLTLVVVLNADQGLFSTEFRAPERLAQTIVQVAGRAGRGEQPGEVLIQTAYPQHPLLQSLLQQGYEGFCDALLVERRNAQWPPYAHLAVLRASAISAAAALDFLRQARGIAPNRPGVRLVGPAPAIMARRAGRHHAQLTVESARRSDLQRFLDLWQGACEELARPRDLRIALDVDPLELFN